MYQRARQGIGSITSSDPHPQDVEDVVYNAFLELERHDPAEVVSIIGLASRRTRPVRTRRICPHRDRANAKQLRKRLADVGWVVDLRHRPVRPDEGRPHRSEANTPRRIMVTSLERRGNHMQVDDHAVGDVVKRLRRVEGQIRGVIAMLEDGRDCAEVVTQLAAVSRALDRAGFKIIASGLQQCVTAQANGDDRSVDMEQMEKLFLSLA